jgi:hypothetical protein
MKSFAIAVLLSAAFPALGQDVKSDAAKDGRDLAQQMVTKLHGISSMDTAVTGDLEKSCSKSVGDKQS